LTFKFTLAYDGTRYVGWQRQADGVSIQGLLEDALARFEGRPVTVDGAGRTDAGVHALGQVASAHLQGGHDAASLLRGINATLPPDVRVVEVQEAADDFHARFSARGKTYRYAIRNAPGVSPFEHPYVWHVPESLNIDAMAAAAAQFIGTHDFSAFRSAGSDVKDAIRTVTKSVVIPNPEPTTNYQPPTTNWQSGLLFYEVSATGFLRHMVRAIVGTLVEVGRGWRSPDSIATLLRDRRRADAGATAPPHGLFLVSVTYD
jgi:tRNA pseudouridine38-40 synthase